MRWLPVLRTESAILAAVLVIGGLIGWATNRASAADGSGYAVITGDDLEPFRSDFNANSDHVRLVLLVGPT